MKVRNLSNGDLFVFETTTGVQKLFVILGKSTWKGKRLHRHCQWIATKGDQGWEYKRGDWFQEFHPDAQVSIVQII